MENAVPIVTQAPGAQPLQIQPGLLTQVEYHREGPNRVLGALKTNGAFQELQLLAFEKSSLHPFFHKPSLRIVSIDGGWKSLGVPDPAPAGSCFLPERILAKLSLSLSLLLLSPPHSLFLLCRSPGG